MNAPAPIGVVAHYNLLERLEPSGPGDLYRARDTRLGRTVALRLLPADFTTGADSRAALVAQVIVDLMAHAGRSLPSRVEVRPSQPPRKG